MINNNIKVILIIVMIKIIINNVIITINKYYNYK